MKTLLKNGTVVNNNGMFKADVLLDGEIISQVGENLTDDQAVVINAEGQYILPGLFDMHVHLREPGFTHKETIETGCKAAIAGGFTGIACMPNTNPVVDNEALVRDIRAKSDRLGYARVYPIAAATKGCKGKEITEYGCLLEAGAVAFSDDGRPVENDLVMRNALLYAKNFDAVICSHCEELSLVNDGAMNEGVIATFLGLRGNTRAAEEVMIAREIILAQTMDARVHICHVSTEYGFELVRQAKARGVRVTCETAPHYFALTDDACSDFDTNTKVNPPLREERDRQATLRAIADGTVDAIASDHAPHHLDDKLTEFDQAANGISGLETMLALSYEHLVKSGLIPMEKLVSLLSSAPSEILRVQENRIEAGARCDVVLFDPNKKWVVDPKLLYTKGKNSAWIGKELVGKVQHVWRDGVHVLADERIMEV